MSQLTEALKLFSGSSNAWLSDKRHTYSPNTFTEDVARMSSALSMLNIDSGDNVLLALPNSYEFVVIYVGLLNHGAVVVPGNPQMPAAELARFLGRFEAKAAFVTTEMEDDWAGVLTATGQQRVPFSNVFEGAETLQDVGCWRAATELTCASGEHSQAAGAKVPSAPSDEQAGVLMFTSGTTGKPKGVLLRHRHLMHAVRNVIKSHQLTSEDVAYCALPLFHINAQVIVMLSTLCTGGCLVMVDRFHATTFWTDMERYGVTWVSSVPTILSILAKRDLPDKKSHQLRFIRSASAPLSPAILSRFEGITGIPVVESYGMTEAAGQICINPLEPGLRKAGSVGLPCGVELNVVVGGSRKAKPNEVGEIVIRGDSIIEQYLSQSSSSLPANHPFSGFILTGDLGYQDEDGYVFITGRAKEMINRAGEKLSPREIEDVLNAHLGVEKSAVIGVPDMLYGERVVAYIVPSDMTPSQAQILHTELERLCETGLSRHKRPSEIRMVASLPVGPTGKVQKHLLKDSLATALLA